MPTLTFLNETYDCARAQKGTDFVRLLDENNIPVFYADGISDFTPYVLTDGEWEPPLAVVAPSVSAYATLSGSVVVLDIPASVKVESGLLVNFTAPCDCTAVTKMSVGGILFDLVNSLDEVVVGTHGAFRAGAKISAVLSVETNKAYLQNVGVTRVETGSFEGTGTESTATNPLSLTFSFVPQVVFIRGKTAADLHIDGVFYPGSYTTEYEVAAGGYHYGTFARSVDAKMVGTTLSWYCGDFGNTSGYTYHYVAIG